MATVTITKDNFDQIIAENDLVVLDFWAEWCGPCKAYGPVFAAVSDKHEDVVFGKIDTEAERELAGAFGIRGIPSTVFFREQMPIHLQSGALPPEALEDLIKQVRGLDMEQVKAEIDKRKADAEAGGGDDA